MIGTGMVTVPKVYAVGSVYSIEREKLAFGPVVKHFQLQTVSRLSQSFLA
jgi:hypothetical protein